jgi:hypothetical protein
MTSIDAVAGELRACAGAIESYRSDGLIIDKFEASRAVRTMLIFCKIPKRDVWL